MPFGHRRSDLQLLAQAKLADAKLLLQHERFSNAYYLAGYAVECGLKACIAKQFSTDTIPDKTFVNAIHQHELKPLVNLAGLQSELKRAEDNNANFSWAIVSEWRAESRYVSIDPYTAQTMIAAIEDPTVGVLPWIKTFW